MLIISKFQLFQDGQPVIDRVRLTATARQIQIDAAMRTESPAILLTKHLHGDLQHDLLKNQEIQINEIILIINKIEVFSAQLDLLPRLPFLSRYEGIVKPGMNGKMCNFQTPGTIHLNGRIDLSLKENGFPEPPDGTGNLNPICGKNAFFLTGENLSEPVSLFGKLKFQSLFRDVFDIDLQTTPLRSSINIHRQVRNCRVKHGSRL
jgi:hypothetical protein